MDKKAERVRHRQRFPCIYCLNPFPLEGLSDEHVIPNSLGSRLKLKKAACTQCNCDKVKPLDALLADKFPPTALARTDLDLRSYKGARPKVAVIGKDPNIGEFEVLLRPGGVAEVRRTIRHQDGSLLLIAPDRESAAKYITQQTKGKVILTDGARTGYITSPSYRFKEPIDWRAAHRAVAKVFYCYILLELGESTLNARPIRMLREYVLGAELGVFQEPIARVSRDVPIAGEGPIEVPRHHHAMMFDSFKQHNNWVCFFGLFQFSFPMDLSVFTPRGRMIGLNPQTREIVESITRHEGTWRFRTSHRFGWARGNGLDPPIVRREPL